MAVPKKKASDVYQAHGEVTRIVSLANGSWAYLTDANGKLHHERRASNSFALLCAELDAALDGRASRELQELGWDDVLVKLKEPADVG